jgi:hypothetical protein
VSVSEPAADAFDLLDQSVVAPDSGVGDPGGHKRADFGPPRIDGGGQGKQFGDVGFDAPGQEAAQTMAGQMRVTANAYGRQHVSNSEVSAGCDHQISCAPGTIEDLRRAREVGPDQPGAL